MHGRNLKRATYKQHSCADYHVRVCTTYVGTLLECNGYGDVTRMSTSLEAAQGCVCLQFLYTRHLKVCLSFQEFYKKVNTIFPPIECLEHPRPY